MTSSTSDRPIGAPGPDEPVSVADFVPPGVTVAAVARRLGVAPATLRTWDRRYGLGPSEHTAGAHRRYSAVDVQRLEAMRQFVFDGVAPADAARAALAMDVTATGTQDAASAASEAPAPEPARSRTGGGRVVPIHGGSPRARGLARAALALDAPSVRRIVRSSLEERGTIWTWDHLLAPVLIGVGDRFQSTGQGVDLEHLLSEGIVAALREFADAQEEKKGSRAVLLAAAPEEQHTLPLYAVAAGLAERGVSTRNLGPRLPEDALVNALKRSCPPAVMLWSHDEITGDPSVLRALPSLRPAPVVVLGGPGWPADLPKGIQRAADLSDAVTRLTAASRHLG